MCPLSDTQMACYTAFGPHISSPQLFCDTFSLTIAICGTIQRHHPNTNRGPSPDISVATGLESHQELAVLLTLRWPWCSLSSQRPTWAAGREGRSCRGSMERRRFRFTNSKIQRLSMCFWVSSHPPDTGHDAQSS